MHLDNDRNDNDAAEEPFEIEYSSDEFETSTKGMKILAQIKHKF